MNTSIGVIGFLIVSLATAGYQASQPKLPSGAGGGCPPVQISLSATKELKHPGGPDLGLAVDGQNFPVGTWNVSVKTQQGLRLAAAPVTVAADGNLHWTKDLTSKTAANMSCDTPLTAFAANGTATYSATGNVVCPGQ